MHGNENHHHQVTTDKRSHRTFAFSYKVLSTQDTQVCHQSLQEWEARENDTSQLIPYNFLSSFYSVSSREYYLFRVKIIQHTVVERVLPQTLSQ